MLQPLFVAMVGMGTLALGLWLISLSTRTVRALVRVPLKAIAELKPGERVRLRGALRAPSPVATVLSPGEAALVRTSVDEVVQAGPRKELRRVRSELSVAPGLKLEDATGSLRLELAGAEIHEAARKAIVTGTIRTPEALRLTGQLGLDALPGRQVTEESVGVGTDVLVIGTVTSDAEGLRVGAEGATILWASSDAQLRAIGSSERILGWILLVAGSLVTSVAVRLWDKLAAAS